MRSVKQGAWKLIEYESATTGVRETQLFNLEEKPHELITEPRDPKVTALTNTPPAKHQTNLAKDPQHAAKLAEMRKLLLAEMRGLNDPWRFSNQPGAGLTPPKSGKPRAERKSRKESSIWGS